MSRADETDGLIQANAAFYAALEQADFDAMDLLWADDDGVVCVHPAASPIRGRDQVMKAWVALMAGAPYIQFFLTDVEARVHDGVGILTCVENVLSAGADTPLGSFAGGSAVATNVFRLTDGNWRLWVHHASPVLSSPGPHGPEGPHELPLTDGGDEA